MEQYGDQSAIGKKKDEIIEFTRKVSKFPNFFVFDNIVPTLDPFRKFTSIRNIIGSRLKRVATGSVSKRYQTGLFTQLSKTLHKNSKFLPHLSNI